MFVDKASVFIDELTSLEPEIVARCRSSLEMAKGDLDFIRLGREGLETCVLKSIGYAVMERTKRAGMVPLSISWNDLGNWSSIWEEMDKDEADNVKLGDMLTSDCSGCLFHAEDHLNCCHWC